MSRKKDSTVTVQVFGIEYPEFAKLKWQQFLRGFSLAVALLVLVVLFLAIGKQLPSEMPVSVILVLVLVILAVFAVYRSNIRREHKRSGLANQRLEYQFERAGESALEQNLAGPEKSKRTASLPQSPKRKPGTPQIYDPGSAQSGHRLVYREKRKKTIKIANTPLTKGGICYIIFRREF